MTSADPLFKLQGVSKSFRKRAGILADGKIFYALKDIDMTLEKGKVYGLVGESGSGKSTLARILSGLAEASGGEVLYRDKDLRKALSDGKSTFRHEVQMVFQNPYLSLDPKWRIDQIIEEGILFLPKKERRESCLRALAEVGLPVSVLSRRPSALSGGERQRVAIARAIAMRPSFLILDEPTSQLDVSVQAKILKLLKALHSDLRCGMLFISHDLAVISEMADEIMVLHDGHVVDFGPKHRVLKESPKQYTSELLAAVPRWKGNA